MYPISLVAASRFEEENPQVLRITDGVAASTTTTAGPDSELYINNAASGSAVSVVITIPPTQTGSGVPSADNPRPMVGFYNGSFIVYNTLAYGGESRTYSDTWRYNPGITIYGGTWDITTGKITVTHGYIASYSGETLPGEWISSIDEYAPGTTPSVGAEVVYALAPAQVQEYQTSSRDIVLYETDNCFSVQLNDTSNNIYKDIAPVTIEYTPLDLCITEEDVMLNGFNIDRYSSTSNRIEVGTAIAAQMTLKLNNHDGKFSNVQFEGREVHVNVGACYSPSNSRDTIFYVPCGYFTFDQQPRNQSIISLTALDRMTKLDAAQPTLVNWVDQSGNYITDHNGNRLVFAAELIFPATVSNLVSQICDLRGITLAASIDSLPNASYNITALPTLQQTITYRNLIQWCAGLMGTCAFMDWNGQLCFKWYDAVSYTSTATKRYKGEVAENDITLTGVSYTNTQNATLVSGDAAYPLGLGANYLVGGGEATILPEINNVVNGFTYRPFDAQTTPAIWLWPMDVITYTDADNNSSSCIVTNVNFGLNTHTVLAGHGETAQINEATTPSPMTAEQGLLVEKVAESTVKLDESLNQESIFNRLTNNGQTQGIILHDGQLYINASYIQTGTLSADLIKAGVIRDETGKSYWDLVTGILNIIGTFAAELTTTSGTFKMELVAGGLELSLDGTKIASIMWRDMFLGQGLTMRAEQVTLDALTQDSQGQDNGGAAVTANNDGTLYLTCDELGIGEADGVHTLGYTGSLSFDDYDGYSHTITVQHGIITNIS